MEDPQNEIREVVRSLCEPRDAKVMLQNVERYFAPEARIIHPMFNSPASSGIDGVKSGYKMLRGR